LRVKGVKHQLISRAISGTWAHAAKRRAAPARSCVSYRGISSSIKWRAHRASALRMLHLYSLCMAVRRGGRATPSALFTCLPALRCISSTPRQVNGGMARHRRCVKKKKKSAAAKNMAAASANQSAAAAARGAHGAVTRFVAALQHAAFARFGGCAPRRLWRSGVSAHQSAGGRRRQAASKGKRDNGKRGGVTVPAAWQKRRTANEG